MGQVPYDDKAVAEDTTLTAVDAIDMGLDRLEKGIGILRNRLAPVLTNYATLMEATMLEAPRREAASALRSRAERLTDLNSEIDAIISILDI